MFYTYLLQNKESHWYTGYTRDLKKRFIEHNTKKSEYTKHRGPYKLIFYEACLNEDDAKAREIYLKSGMGKQYIKNGLKRFLSLTV